MPRSETVQDLREQVDKLRHDLHQTTQEVGRLRLLLEQRNLQEQGAPLDLTELARRVREHFPDAAAITRSHVVDQIEVWVKSPLWDPCLLRWRHPTWYALLGVLPASVVGLPDRGPVNAASCVMLPCRTPAAAAGEAVSTLHGEGRL
jgi:hypothetical protein